MGSQLCSYTRYNNLRFYLNMELCSVLSMANEIFHFFCLFFVFYSFVAPGPNKHAYTFSGELYQGVFNI